MNSADSATKLFHILYSPELLPQFRQILISICCEENLDFFTTVEIFKKTLLPHSPADEKAKKVATELIANHLSPDSPIPVNISLRVKKQIKEDMTAGNFHLKLFDEAQKEVYIMLLQKFIQEQKLQAVYNPKKVAKALTKNGGPQNPFSTPTAAPAPPPQRPSSSNSSSSLSAPPPPPPTETASPAIPKKPRTVAQLNAALNEILNHDELLGHFKQLTIKMKNEENLNFWLEAEAYKKIFKDAPAPSALPQETLAQSTNGDINNSTGSPPPLINGASSSNLMASSLPPELLEKAKSKALDMKKRFFGYGAEPVNLDDSIVQGIMTKINKENFLPTLFDQGQKMCFMMMRESALPNFLKSDVYLAFEAKRPPAN